MEKMIKANIAVTIFQLLFFEVIVPPFYPWMINWIINKLPCRWDAGPHRVPSLVTQSTRFFKKCLPEKGKSATMKKKTSGKTASPAAHILHPKRISRTAEMMLYIAIVLH
jgi:hypothetical protein